MNNETSPNLLSQIIFETYTETIQLYTYFGSLTLLFYASLLHFPDEVKYIWRRKFTLPTYLYFLAKYPVFVFFFLFIVSDFLSETSSSLHLCNILGLVGEVVDFFSFIGSQGLILFRTYSLCHGYRPVSIILFITFMAAVITKIYTFTIPVCLTGEPGQLIILLDLLINISTIILDILAFIAVIHQVWGLWKLKRSLGLQNSGDFVTVLLQQGVLSFLFVISMTTTVTFLIMFAPVVGNYIVVFQIVLSILLICEFSLDLRRRNAQRPVPNQSAINLPTLSFQSFRPVQTVGLVLGRLHENIIAEMGERTDRVDLHGPFLEELQNDLQGESHDTNLDREGNPAEAAQ